MSNFIIGLGILWRGMLSMFVTMGIIMCLTLILTKVTAKKKKDEKEES